MNFRIGLLAAILLLAFSAAALLGFDPEPPRKKIDLKDRLTADEVHRPAPRRDPDVYVFGFEQRASPAEDARRGAAFLDYLSKATGCRVEMRFVPRNGRVVDDLGRGRIHFAAVGAGTFVRAHEAYGVIPVARGIDRSGGTRCRAVIAVAPESGIRSVEDLKGRSLIFGRFDSTLGHLVPRIILAEHGIDLRDFNRVEYAASSRDCANAVAARRFDAGGLPERLAAAMQGSGALRILATSPAYPSTTVAAFRNVPPEALRKVTRALVGYRPAGREADRLRLRDAAETALGFEAARPGDYEAIRTWASRFGMIDPQPD